VSKPRSTVYLPKPITSGLNAKGRFGKQDFLYVAAEDVYRCTAGEQLIYHYPNEEDGKTLRRCWTNACQGCALKSQCTPAKNDGSHVGSTKPSLRPCKQGSIETQPKCAFAARPSSIHSAR
jgi:hypothetical protein